MIVSQEDLYFYENTPEVEEVVEEEVVEEEEVGEGVNYKNVKVILSMLKESITSKHNYEKAVKVSNSRFREQEDSKAKLREFLETNDLI